jgi:tetratricopeptide (TPR) repeat protein
LAANKRKILEAARKYAQKGAKDRALKEYEKLLKLDPRDAKLRLEIGDAHRRWGQLDKAIETYVKVAEQYMAEGFDARAVAVYKQIQNLDPEHWAIYEPLAELYQRMGLAAEAAGALQAAADGYNRAGERKEALSLLRKMAALDPSNTASRLKVAGLLRQEGLDQEAISEYEGTADELERQGERDQAVSALERVLEIDAGRISAIERMARNLVKMSQADRAEPFARRLLDAKPDVPEHYEILAEVHRMQSREDALADVYRRLAELYRQRGDEDRAREITQRFVPPDGLSLSDPLAGSSGNPDDTLSGDLSGFLEDDEGGSGDLLGDDLLEPVAPPASSRPPETVLYRDEEPDDAAQTVAGQAPAPKAAPAPDEPFDAEQLLAEACVYLRYGKRDQALESLERIVAREERHRPALEKLGEALAESGQTERAVEIWLRAAALAQETGDETALGVLRDRIAALDQAAAATLTPAAEPEEDYLEISQPVAPAGPDVGREASVAVAPAEEESLDLAGDEPQETAPDEPPDDIEIEIDTGLEDEPEADEQSRGAGAPAGASQSVGSSTSTAQQVNEDLEEAEFYLQQGLLDEAEAIYKRLLEVAPNHPQVLVRVGELAAMRGDDPGATSGGTPAAGDPEPDVPSEEARPEEIPDELTDWTDGELDEQSLAADEIPQPDVPAAADEAEALSLQAAAEEVPASVEDGATPVELEPGLEPEPALEPEPEPEPEPAPAPELTGETTSEIDALEDLVSDEDEPAPPPPDEAARELDRPAPRAEGGFDLAAELEDALDPDPNSRSSTFSGGAGDSFAAVFHEFKKGVSKTLSDNDHEAHYDLGIAYREMGLFDDAMGEFRAAMGSPARRLECMHMLGLCSLELGQSEQAVAYLQEVVADGSLSEDQRLPLRFDLGRAFESQGDVESARAAWEAVAAVDPEFGEVTERLRSLGEPAKPEPAAVAEPEPEPASFESFDDLMDDLDESDAAPPAGAAEPAIEEAAVEAEPEPDLEPDPEPGPEPDEKPEADSRPRRRKRKISFV